MRIAHVNLEMRLFELILHQLILGNKNAEAQFLCLGNQFDGDKLSEAVWLACRTECVMNAYRSRQALDF